MTRRFVAGLSVLLAIAAFFGFAFVAAVQTQAPTTQTRPVPRTPDGHPDFSGIWQAMNTAAWDIQAHQAQKGVPGGLGVVVGNQIPYQPWAAAKRKENHEKRATADPESKCYLPGVPRIMYMPFPFQIFQTQTQVTMLFEYVHAVRNVFMGSPHLRGPIDWWMGDSRGRWEGDTLVVDVVHFNADTWFDRAGNFHSEDLHVIERYTLTDADHFNYEATIEDPKVFTAPWKMSMVFYRHTEPSFQLLDYECYVFDYSDFIPAGPAQ
jgi:hypothetical protein